MNHEVKTLPGGKKVLILDRTVDLSDSAAIREVLAEAEKAGLTMGEDAVGFDVESKPLSHRRFMRVALNAMRGHLDQYRAAPRDLADPFDYGGAMASLCESIDVSGQPPQDDVGDMLARAAILGVRIDSAIRRASAQALIHIADEDEFRGWVKNAAERSSFALSATAAWARDGFPTFDLSAGLWDVLRRSMDDPGVAATPVSRITPPHRAFAARIPGPDYPMIDDYEIRGFMLYAFDDAPRSQDVRRVQEAMDAASAEVDDAAFLTRSRRADAQRIYRDLANAGRAALPVDTCPSFLLMLAGYDTSADSEGPRTAGAIETAQLLMRLGVKGPHTPLREANEYAREDTALRNPLPNQPERGRLPTTYDEIVNAALGLCLYLASVDDPGKPIRAKPVRRQNGRPVTPDRRLLGQGLKHITQSEEKQP